MAERVRTGQLSRPAGGGHLGYLALLGVSGLLNAVFQFLSGHLLDPAGYGALASVLALLGVGSVLLSALTTSYTRALTHADPSSGLTVLCRRAARFALVSAVVVTASSPLLGIALSVPVVSLWLLAAWIVASCFEAVFKASLVTKWRAAYVAASLVATAALRLVLGAVLIDPFGVNGAMAATFLAEAVFVVALWVPTRHRIHGPDPVRPSSAAEFSYTAMSQFGTWALLGAAVVIGRMTLDPAASGEFAAAVTLASGAVFLLQGLGVKLYPSMVSGDHRQALRSGLKWALLVGASVIATCSIAGPRLVQLLFGADFAPSRAVCGLSALAAACAGVAVVAQYALMARRRLTALLAWAALGVVVVAVVTLSRHGLSEAVLAAVMAVAWTVTALVMVVAARRDKDLSSAPVDLGQLGAPASCSVSIVVPGRDPGVQVREVISALASVLGPTDEIIAVDDGSRDGSFDDIERLVSDPDSPRVRVITHDVNRGKGAALLTGFQAARGQVVAYVDGDGDIAPTQILDLIDALQPGTWAAIGTKYGVHRADVPLLRKVVSLGWRALVSVLFDLGVSDTQVGIKAFRREQLHQALGLCREAGYVLDLEILVRGHQLHLGDIHTVPVRIERVGSSTVKRRTVIAMFLGALAVWSQMPDASAHERTAPPWEAATGAAS